jgi:hypothetical protein
MGDIESLIEDAIELIESDWVGTSGSSPGNRWLAEARETLDEIKKSWERISELEKAVESYANMLGNLQLNRPIGVHCPQCGRDHPECAGPWPCYYQKTSQSDANAGAAIPTRDGDSDGT